jgi:hypothetical protein
MASNDRHENAVQAAELTAAGFAPSNPLESGLAVTLAPGAYSLARRRNHGTATGVVEGYDRGTP